MFGWLRRLGRRVLGRSEGALVRAGVPSTVVINSDGWIPASQFTGGGALDALFHASCFAYACIMANATEAASLGAQVQRRQSDGRWLRAPHRELQALLDAPSGALPRGELPKPPQWTWQQLIFLVCAHLDIDGNGYWVPTLVNGGRRVWSVAPLLPNRVSILEDSGTLYPREYDIGAMRYRPEDVVHYQFPSPLSFSDGHAPIQTALRAISIDYTAEGRTAWNLENKISPGVIVSVKGFVGASEEQKTAILTMLQEQYAGASKDGSPLVFGENTELVGAPSQKGEIDYSAITAAALSKMIAVFLTPPPIIGQYDNATLNNFQTAFKLWWLVRLFPTLKNIYSTLNTQLIHPVYGPEWRLWYDDAGSDIALVLERERVAAAAALVAIGYPPNLAARHVGLDIEHVPELDVPLQNLAVAGRAQSEN